MIMPNCLSPSLPVFLPVAFDLKLHNFRSSVHICSPLIYSVSCSLKYSIVTATLFQPTTSTSNKLYNLSNREKKCAKLYFHATRHQSRTSQVDLTLLYKSWQGNYGTRRANIWKHQVERGKLWDMVMKPVKLWSREWRWECWQREKDCRLSGRSWLKRGCSLQEWLQAL